jgi:hypothetical protein
MSGKHPHLPIKSKFAIRLARYPFWTVLGLFLSPFFALLMWTPLFTTLTQITSRAEFFENLELY